MDRNVKFFYHVKKLLKIQVLRPLSKAADPDEILWWLETYPYSYACTLGYPPPHTPPAILFCVFIPIMLPRFFWNNGKIEVSAYQEAKVGPSFVLSLNYVKERELFPNLSCLLSLPSTRSQFLPSFPGDTHELPVEAALVPHGNHLVQGAPYRVILITLY